MDLNLHSPTSGCYRTNSSGLRTEDLLLSNALFLKSRASTLFNVGSDTLSDIDLPIYSPSFPTHVLENAPGHLREQRISCADNNTNPRSVISTQKRRCVNLADYTGLQAACTPMQVSRNTEEDVYRLTAAITLGAAEHVPRTGGHSSRTPVRWCNTAMKDAIREKR